MTADLVARLEAYIAAREAMRGLDEVVHTCHSSGGSAAISLSDLREAASALRSSGEAVSAESRLAEVGVFKGHHGLRGLAEADAFWDQQPYGTRLYYGDGGLDYLHRGGLRAAVKALDTTPPTSTKGG